MPSVLLTDLPLFVFQAALEYFNEKFDYYKAERGFSRPAPILVSKTPGKTAKPEAAASTKGESALHLSSSHVMKSFFLLYNILYLLGMGLNHERKLADTSTNQVSSSAYDHNDVSLSRKTLRPRRIKVITADFRYSSIHCFISRFLLSFFITDRM